MKYSLIPILLLSFYIFSEARICPEINISSNISKIKDDMVRSGITALKWTELSSTPIIIGSTKQIDYIYVTIEKHLDDTLNVNKLYCENFYSKNDKSSHFKLNFDDHIYANSTWKLDISHPKEKETEYAVEVNYLCNDYGGSLINVNSFIFHENIENYELFSIILKWIYLIVVKAKFIGRNFAETP